MKVLILAGGKGTRLGLTGIPKPMVPVAGVPLLQRLVELCRNAGFTDITILSGFLGNVIEEYFADGSRFGVTIKHVMEDAPLGTAGATKFAAANLVDPFLVMYGDILLDVDLRHFAEFARRKGGYGSLFVHPNDHPHDSDLLEVDQDSRIIHFLPKPHEQQQPLPNLVSAALYVLHPDALQYVPSGVSDWGRDVFPKLATSGDLFAYRSVEYAKDIGTPARLQKAEGQLKAGIIERLSRRRPKPAVFLDRDGVINQERNGVLLPEQMELIPGAASALKTLNTAGVPAICVTNQPALAKGQVSWEGLRLVHRMLDSLLAKEAGAYLDDMFVCPHHEERGWPGEVPALKIDCDCRKPKPGLLLRASEFHNLALGESWLIGDRYCDIAAAKAVGARAVLVRTGHAGSDRARFTVEPDFVVDDASEAIGVILEQIL